MKYFQQLPKTRYDVTGNGEFTVLTDISRNFKVREGNISNNSSYMNHIISDGERPDVTSYILYGTANYHWTFFVINENLRKGLSEWPMSQYELDTFISDRYNQYACLTFSPISSVSAEVGNIAFVPFNTKYNKDLYVVPVDDNGDEVVFGGNQNPKCYVEKYDALRNQLVLRRSSLAWTGNYVVENLVQYTKFKIRMDEDSTYYDEFYAALADSYATIYDLEDPSDLTYECAVDSTANKNTFNYGLYKNAPYIFYDINDDTQSLTHYEVLSSSGAYTSYGRMTYAEMEEVLNNRKRTIRVINPLNVADFSREYMEVVRNA